MSVYVLRMSDTLGPIETADPTESFDISHVVPSEPTLADILTRRTRPGWKPRISHLEDAVVDGKFVPKVGEKVLVEYVKDQWRDTVCWIVAAVFDTPEKIEGTTCSLGHVRLYDPSKTHYGTTNYLTGPSSGEIVLKIPDKSPKWTQGEEETLQELAKRGGRRKRFVNDEEPPAVPQAKLDENGKPVQKKRGRPKGSKNKTTLAKEAVEVKK